MGHVELDRAPRTVDRPAERGKPSPLTSLVKNATRLAYVSWRVWRADRPSIFAYRRVPLHDPDFPLVLLFSPKSGCSSLVNWFLFQTERLEDAVDHHAWVHQYRGKAFNERPGYREEAVRLMVSGERPIVKLVRNPFDRAMSSYLHTLRGAHERRENDWAFKLIAAARKYRGLDPAPSDALSFRDFLLYLAYRRCNIAVVNTHVAHQYMRAEAGRVTRLLKLETLVEDLRALETDFGLLKSPTSLFESKHHRIAASKAEEARDGVAAIEFTNADARKNRIPPYRSFLDLEMRSLIRRCYAPDFKHYGYD